MRLFVAADLPDAVRHAIAERVVAERDLLPPASWVRLGNLHLTLLFLGDVADGEAVTAAQFLQAALASSSGLEASITAPGAFPERGPIRVVWLGLEPGEALAELADRLRDAARAAGLPFDPKPFHPHLTLARCRRPWPNALRDQLARLALGSSLRFRIDRLALVASELGKSGSTYTTVAALALREAA